MADQTNSFLVRGTVAPLGAVTISWSDGVFDDPSGMVETLIASKAQVCATPTGPCYTASASPPEVALLTAVEALDHVAAVEGAAAAQAALAAQTAVPADASA